MELGNNSETGYLNDQDVTEPFEGESFPERLESREGEADDSRQLSSIIECDAKGCDIRLADPEIDASPQQFATSYDNLKYPVEVHGITACVIRPAKDHRKVSVEKLGLTPEELSQPHSDTPGFSWIIGTTNSDHIEPLNSACLKLFEQPFAEVTLKKDSGLRKAVWINGILNGHISRFSIAPDDPLCVDRTVLEVLVCKDGLMSVDHAGNSEYLLDLKRDIDQGRYFRTQVDSVGALSALIIEKQLNENEKVLDQLERHADHYAEIASTGPLSRDDALKAIPKLQKTLEYFRRKAVQVEEVLIALYQADDDNGMLFNGRHENGSSRAPSLLRGCEQKLKNLIAHADGVIKKLENVERLHDRQEKAATDKNIERFTIVVGLSAPPIIADFACKFFLENYHHTHSYVMGAAFLAGVALVLRAEIPKFIRNVWMYQHFGSTNQR